MHVVPLRVRPLSSGSAIAEWSWKRQRQSRTSALLVFRWIRAQPARRKRIVESCGPHIFGTQFWAARACVVTAVTNLTDGWFCNRFWHNNVLVRNMSQLTAMSLHWDCSSTSALTHVCSQSILSAQRYSNSGGRFRRCQFCNSYSMPHIRVVDSTGASFEARVKVYDTPTVKDKWVMELSFVCDCLVQITLWIPHNYVQYK